MIELTSPTLRDCPLCNSEPMVEKGWDYHDLTICFMRVKCTKCGHYGHWVKFVPEDLATVQQAIDETSRWWNNHKIYDDED